MQPIQRRLLYILLLAAGLAWIFSSTDRTGASTAGRIPAPQKGFLAPDFTLATPSGTRYTLSELRGKPVLINFWATWCPPCQEEMPAIEKFYEQDKDQGLVVLGVDSTAQELYPLGIVPFVTQDHLTFPILLDETGDVNSKYQVQVFPSSFFVDRSGIIQQVEDQKLTEALLQIDLQEILKSSTN